MSIIYPTRGGKGEIHNKTTNKLKDTELIVLLARRIAPLLTFKTDVNQQFGDVIVRNTVLVDELAVANLLKNEEFSAKGDK